MRVAAHASPQSYRIFEEGSIMRRHLIAIRNRAPHAAAKAGRLIACLLPLAAALGPAAVGTGNEPATAELRPRNIVRKQLPKHVKSIALEYSIVLLDENGKEISVDPIDKTFKVGDSFLVKIRPQDDMYVYVFTEGPKGDRACLIPARNEKPFFVTKDTDIKIPDDGGYFTFNPPAGEEKLLVVAVSEPTDDVRILARTVFKEKSGTLKTDAEKAANAAQGDAAARGIRDRCKLNSRGPSKALLERAKSAAPDARHTNVEPPGDGEQTSFALAVAGPEAGNPELILDIPLRSQATR
jgi:hypothetical protein